MEFSHAMRDNRESDYQKEKIVISDTDTKEF